MQTNLKQTNKMHQTQHKNTAKLNTVFLAQPL